MEENRKMFYRNITISKLYNFLENHRLSLEILEVIGEKSISVYIDYFGHYYDLISTF